MKMESAVMAIKLTIMYCIFELTTDLYMQQTMLIRFWISNKTKASVTIYITPNRI